MGTIIGEGITFDDVLLVPQYSEVTPNMVIGLEDSAFWSFSKQPESDRKAFFVAISRAKEKLYFTFCRGRQTGRNFYQTKDTINEFYELFKKSGIVKNIKQL